MSLTFWDTVRGRDLADSLISNLSKIAKSQNNFAFGQSLKQRHWKLSKKVLTDLEKANFVKNIYSNEERYLIILEES